ncbi:uncharacterized protein [Cardiocondyla obscurior]|uniref:uncharacterized protein isoform X1 n=1 Tax=Cardiocondyla obscurior TaxID=286306 RepID=UPI0039655C60
MEDDNRQEESNEVVRDVREDGMAGQQERSSDNQYNQSISTSPSSRKRTRDDSRRDKKRTRSRSRSRSRSKSRSRSRSTSNKPPQRRQWRSANAFLNFMQDFRQVMSCKDGNACECYVIKPVPLQNHTKVKSKDLFRLGGQTWRQMSSAEKMPYVEAAKLAQQSQQNSKRTRQRKPNSNDSSKNSESQRDQIKPEAKKERRRSRSKSDDSDTNSDSATGKSATSDDVSDLSS